MAKTIARSRRTRRSAPPSRRAIRSRATRKLIAFEADVLRSLILLARDRMQDFQELADEAFRDLLKKHRRPVTLKEQLTQSGRRADERLNFRKSRAGNGDVPLSQPFRSGGSGPSLRSDRREQWGTTFSSWRLYENRNFGGHHAANSLASRCSAERHYRSRAGGSVLILRMFSSAS